MIRRCVFEQEKLQFLGYVVGRYCKNSISADPSKVAVIEKMKSPRIQVIMSQEILHLMWLQLLWDPKQEEQLVLLHKSRKNFYNAKNKELLRLLFYFIYYYCAKINMIIGHRYDLQLALCNNLTTPTKVSVDVLSFWLGAIYILLQKDSDDCMEAGGFCFKILEWGWACTLL